MFSASCLGLRKCPKSVSRQKLPNPKRMLRYDLPRWLTSSHVGSLFKFWLCAKWIFTIVSRLASPLCLIVVERARPRFYIGAVSLASAQYSREDRSRVELSLYAHPTWSVLCWRTGQCFRALPRLAQLSKSVSRKKLPNPKLVLRYDLTRWLISSHVGSLLENWLSAHWLS